MKLYLKLILVMLILLVLSLDRLIAENITDEIVAVYQLKDPFSGDLIAGELTKIHEAGYFLSPMYFKVASNGDVYIVEYYPINKKIRVHKFNIVTNKWELYILDEGVSILEAFTLDRMGNLYIAVYDFKNTYKIMIYNKALKLIDIWKDYLNDKDTSFYHPSIIDMQVDENDNIIVEKIEDPKILSYKNKIVKKIRVKPNSLSTNKKAILKEKEYIKDKNGIKHCHIGLNGIFYYAKRISNNQVEIHKITLKK